MYRSALGDFANLETEEFYLRLMRQKTIEQRISMAMELWQMAVELASANLRQQHSDWSEPQIRAEVARRTLTLDGTTRFTSAGG